MKILIVEDNQKIAILIKIMLELEGYEAMLARNGPEGYWMYMNFHPDLVITDVQMPGENGPDMMNHIREKDPQVKAIYMSGNLRYFYPHLNEEKRNFPVAFLEKPFSREELMERVLGIFSPRKEIREYRNQEAPRA
jgi:DNA-binding NtrC family response regulator